MTKSSKSKHPLCDHLDLLVEDLRGRIPRALEQFDEESIHKARVATRRLKAAIELLDSKLNKSHAKPFARLGRKLRRQLGPMRDLDVMLGHLAKIEIARLHPAVEWFTEQLKAQREQLRKAAHERQSPSELLARLGTWWGLRQDVIDADDQVQTLLRISVEENLQQFHAFADGLGNGTDPHALRISGKALRYTLELAQAQGFEVKPTLLRSFKRMQDLLGAWHDFVVLAERAMQASIESDLALHDVPLQRNVLSLADYALRRAEHELTRFATLWQQQGGELTCSIRSAMGLEPTSLRTDRDPAGSVAPIEPGVSAPATPQAV